MVGQEVACISSSPEHAPQNLHHESVSAGMSPAHVLSGLSGGQGPTSIKVPWNHGKIMESWLHEAGAELRDPRHGASNVMWRGLRPREEKRWPRPCNSQPSGQVRTGRQAPRLPVPGPSHPPPAPVSVSPPYAWRMALQMQPPALASGLKAQPCEVHLQTGRLCL